MSCTKAFLAATALIFVSQTAATQVPVVVTVDIDKPGPVIEPTIYSQMVEHAGAGVYDGIWVEEGSSIPNVRGIRKDVVAALKRIKVPLVRWPGGCFADQYHWVDGVGPRSERPVRRNLWWQDRESNHFGTHEFMDFLEQIGAKPYISINVGSGSVQDARDWIEYMTASDGAWADLRRAHGRATPWKVEYIGIGNEVWGCGGGMQVASYADHLRRYSTFLSFDPASADRRYLVASGPLNNDYEWTKRLMAHWSWTFPATDISIKFFNGVSLHYYTFPDGAWGETKDIGPATGFDERAWFSTLRAAGRMDILLREHASVMDRYDPRKNVALIVDEWGTWYKQDPDKPKLYQQNTLRDALVAALTLNIFHRHTDRVKIAAIAQAVNTMQAMILTDKAKMLLTPTYHVFDLYQIFQGAVPYQTEVSGPSFDFADELPVVDVSELAMVDASAARGLDGRLYLSLVNLDPTRSAEIKTNLRGRAMGRVLTESAMDARNTFEAPNALRPMPFSGMRDGAGQVRFELPPKSVAVVAID